MLWKFFEFKDDNESQNDATCKQCVSDNKSNKYIFWKMKKIRIHSCFVQNRAAQFHRKSNGWHLMGHWMDSCGRRSLWSAFTLKQCQLQFNDIMTPYKHLVEVYYTLYCILYWVWHVHWTLPTVLQLSGASRSVVLLDGRGHLTPLRRAEFFCSPRRLGESPRRKPACAPHWLSLLLNINVAPGLLCHT